MTIKKIQQKSKTITDARGKQIFYTCIIAMGFLFALYLYFLSNTVFSIVTRKNVENDIRAKVTTIGELELKYLTYYSSVDKTLAYDEGYVEPREVYFVSRNTLLTKADPSSYEL